MFQTVLESIFSIPKQANICRYTYIRVYICKSSFCKTSKNGKVLLRGIMFFATLCQVS